MNYIPNLLLKNRYIYESPTLSFSKQGLVLISVYRERGIVSGANKVITPKNISRHLKPSSNIWTLLTLFTETVLKGRKTRFKDSPSVVSIPGKRKKTNPGVLYSVNNGEKVPRALLRKSLGSWSLRGTFPWLPLPSTPRGDPNPLKPANEREAAGTGCYLH